MADLEFLDSFGHYDTATLYQKYNGPANGAVTAGVGRFGVQGLQPGLQGPRRTFKRNLDTIYCGAAFQLNVLLDRVLFIFLDNNTPHATISVRPDGRISILGPGNTEVAVSTAALVTGTFYYIEANLIVANSGGFVEVRVNEVSVVTYTGDTQGASNAFATNIQIGQGASSAPAYISDFYVHTTRYLGDIKVRYIKPNGNGTNRDFSLSTGTDDFAVLDDVPPNGDTDYAYSETVNDKISCAMEDVDLLGGTCEGIQVLANVRKDEANVRKIKTLILEGGTETLGDEESIPTGYYYATTCYDENPRTSAAWTDAQLDAIEAGIKITA